GFDRRYRYVNAAAARHGRSTPIELIGQKMTDLYPGVEATTLYTLLERCLDQRLPAEFENEFTYPNGARAWFTIKMDPIPEGAFILSIDITDRKRAEDSLQEHVTRLEALRAIDLAIVATGDLTSTLEGVLERVVTSLHVDAADLLL
ncbi:MAG TPA: PAS domain-containing protein, partial [Anaerolineales bacterium]|nr:PAS domain-containing protein [Anaerolineales bacterium]